ncbi:MAG: replication-associated recombination protein A [Bacteroidia bacterium]|nr:replication-associated recombination protein A [Bacteroidia bacterium]
MTNLIENIPLAERVRPQSINEFIGQEHLLDNDKPLKILAERNTPSSLIFWGPPGVGKTTLAFLLSKSWNLPFYNISAISSGVKELREIIENADKTGNVLLFIDEIHRFNKSQQDALLGAVEKGIITLIGATTENPSFEVNSALLSRCHVYVLKAFEKIQLDKIIDRAIKQDLILSKTEIIIEEKEALFLYSGGDGRKLLNLLELIVNTEKNKGKVIISNEVVEKVLQQKIALYDKSGEQHYDIISAFIKSLRGSDPNASVYWLARMLNGGEDIRFIARRMIIFASEDIGNANPNALLIALQSFQAIEILGMPEARIILSQAAIYLATSVKSNSSYLAIEKALDIIEKNGEYSVPLHLRNAPTKLMKKMGYSKNYKYAHDFTNNFVNIEYMPEEISGLNLYEPGKNNREEEIRRFLKQRWKDKYNF